MDFNIKITPDQLGRMMADAAVPQESARQLALELLPLSPDGLVKVLAAYERPTPLEDYSTSDLAQMAQERGIDPYQAVAAYLFKVDYADVTPGQRWHAKSRAAQEMFSGEGRPVLRRSLLAALR